MLKSSYDDFWGFKHCKTDGKSVWKIRATMSKNKPHEISFSASCMHACMYVCMYVCKYTYPKKKY